ncbi:sulfatase-like hydrolase/transferase [Pseudoduganella sp. DS3]|uniref:Sulfatase-like hydrolase/transferase n=1 Tax=Pseudoduganella guangdongensis TaxID=2692179 RepID=A0A6N9HM65_9BURK|nr:phosphoethanolamine transferase [Pseudoduganella guangdongensis]MYN04781.1 sulfatase-like hydrolase/transferase [Pseudoduganella guangdongensis]
MRLLLRPSHLFILLSYLALSAVPFVPLLLGKPVEQPWQLLGIELVAWVAVWALFKRPAYFHWLLIPAFLALPTEIYLFVFYGQGISTHHLGILAETSPREALEFLGQKVWTMAAVMVAVAVWWVLSFRAARQTRELDWQDGSRWVALASLVVLSAVAAWGYEFGIAGAPGGTAPGSAAASGSGQASASGEADADSDPSRAAVAGARTLRLPGPPLPHWARLPLEPKAFVESWPFGLAARGYDFYKERRYLSELNERSASFSFGARQLDGTAQPEIVVMVLGESSRYDRWSLNGYSRETNPLLGKEGNLVALSDVITSVSATRLSVPVIISRKPATQSLKDGFSEKSFLTAYKEAGFKTWWLSNQISFGQYDTPVSVFAKEADVIQFLNLGGFTNHSNFDDVLFEPLKRALADPSPKKLIVLHSLGSHWNYSQRHPKEFDKWQPSLFGIDKPVYTDLKIKPQLNNSYDNSILYTDWFLAQVIGDLKATGQLASMLYVADHGQTLYDGTCKLAFHGHNTQYEFHVPAFMWYSEQYRERYPSKVAALHRNRKAKLATENFFHTMLDVADIRYPDDRPSWSFLNPDFKLHKRVVDSYGWTNYDNATMKGDCREVMDKGKPQKQEK